MTREVHAYRAYGLQIRCEFAVPFAPADPSRKPDLTIRVGRTPESLTRGARRGIGFDAAPGRFLLRVGGVGRYLVRDGREIVVEPEGADEAEVRAYLLGSAIGACLQQRGYLTLHASAVGTNAGAALFAGESGVGKSTLLAAFLDRGHAALADDISAISLAGDGRPAVVGAFPHVRLWADALERIRWRAKDRILEEVRRTGSKWYVPVERFRILPLAVKVIFALATHDGDEIAIEPAAPGDAFRLLVRATYRPEFVTGLGVESDHLRMVAALVRDTQVVRVTRPRAAGRLDELTERLAERLGVG